MRTAIAIALTFSGAYVCHAQTTPSTNQQSAAFTRLDDDARQLRDDFNRAKGAVRLILVVDPSCSACLRGMDDISRDLLSTTRDQRLQTFVVHVPVIGAEAKHVLPAAKLLPSQNVRHYWNESGAVGWWLSQQFAIKNSKKSVYAWDVWLLFGPEAQWADKSPTPRVLMHQLEELEGTRIPMLDSKVFATNAREVLASMKHAAAATETSND